ncbi:uncharacterized protein LOC142583576 [Dermacentor variabilis]|uniref:uncharacterized protein LOC142583576 n=1 Tax=Dermacentor variabilis TaxID=34621 RepID=UPI003F5C044A
MAHEIGHLVGSAHDGSENAQSSVDPRTCPEADKKIMSPRLGRNMWHMFSYCSTVQVAEFVMSDKGQCLTTTTTSKVSEKFTFADVNETRPSLDEFCQRHYAEYRGASYQKHSDPRLTLDKCIITCSVPEKPGVIIIDDAPDGTSCNDTRPRAANPSYSRDAQSASAEAETVPITYSGILQHHRLECRLYPPPHPELNKALHSEDCKVIHPRNHHA